MSVLHPSLRAIEANRLATVTGKFPPAIWNRASAAEAKPEPTAEEADAWFAVQEASGVQLSGPASHGNRCCDLARRVMGCVCRERTLCPVHGDRCNGSHE